MKKFAIITNFCDLLFLAAQQRIPGEIDPTVSTLQKIAKTLGVDSSEFFKGVG